MTLAALLQSCASDSAAPVISHHPGSGQAAAMRAPAPGRPPGYHEVKAGDTLFSIAFRFGLDYRQVARWNGIRAPYRIFPGQQILLRPPPPGYDQQPAAVAAVPATRAAVPAQPTIASPPAARPSTPRIPSGGTPSAPPQDVVATPASPAAATTAPAASAETSAARRSEAGIAWQWPARGTVRAAGVGQAALEILGRRGQAIYAAAGGQVVYSGSGLIGYGKLIIIKHNDTFLSAYAHNDKLLVGEGTVVTAGQKIAEMGDSGAKEVILHFEIRRNGKPVPPLDFLPKA
ncbi:MAG: peptidoglycan DD-metalloendopeptidase family protein [Gammaproteobacteria bacterium]